MHDVNTHFNERLADAYVAILRKTFNIIVATSKLRRVSEMEANVIHNALVSAWGKPSRNAKTVSFEQFREAQDARIILEGLLSQVQSGDRTNFSSIFAKLAVDRRKMEGKQISGLRKFFRSLTRLWAR